MSEHHAFLAPSRFPALAQCIHYESVKLDSVARERGTKIHKYFAAFLEQHLHQNKNEHPNVRR